jgi:phosphoglucomutase/phosphomannomutase
MDRAVRTAREIGADLVLATDPDADRIGAMVPDPAISAVQGEPALAGWRFITGNEIGALLTHFKLAELTRQGRLPASPIIIKTDVTTSLVTRIARHFKAQIVQNLLVGFKYIADVLWHLEDEGGFEDVRGTPGDFVLGCEESHGILVTPQIRDKDAAGGAVLLAELVLCLKRQGRTVPAYLEEIYRQFGYFNNQVLNIVMTGIEGKQKMREMLDRLRKSPPAEIGGVEVARVVDWRDEQGPLGPIKGGTDFAARNVLGFDLKDRGRIALRPSGTEPKAKAYIETYSAPCPAKASGEQWRTICADVDELARRLAGDFQKRVLGPGKT